MAPSLKPPFFVVSDTHFFHQRICEYAGRPYDHEVMMVKRWRRTVGEDDIVLHLGDLYFGGRPGFERFRDEVAPLLTGRKFIVLGNHDKRKVDYAALGFTVLKPFACTYRGHTVSFSHYPKLVDDPRRVHIHGHIHNNGYSRGRSSRRGNINVSVEVIDYRPVRVSRLLNRYLSRKRTHVKTRART